MSVPYTRNPLLSARRVSNPYTEKIGCISSVNTVHLQFAEIMHGGCFDYRWVASQAL